FTFNISCHFHSTNSSNRHRNLKIENYGKGGRQLKNRGGAVDGFLLPVDPWAPNIDSESIASQLFALSLFPHLGFLYLITKSKSAPKLTLFGFCFLLAFVGATSKLQPLRLLLIPVLSDINAFFVPILVPARIYAKVKYGTSLSNVDWLHRGAESLPTLTNLFIVLGLREARRKGDDAKDSSLNVASTTKEEKKTSI
ncbi:Protein of unknown function DUF3593, partial [Dillenia turbinata]